MPNPTPRATPRVDWRQHLGKPQSSSHVTLAIRTLGPFAENVNLRMTPGLAAEIGKRLIDWAFDAEPLAAFDGVGRAVEARR